MSKILTLNKLTYKDRALQAGPHNFFRLESGARPSFGIFQCNEGTYSYLFTDERLPAGGDLVFSDDTRTVTLHNIYVVEARPARGYAAAGFPSASNDYGLYDLILADARILWLNIACTQNYNMYKTSRSFEIQEGYSESQNWIWADMIDDLGQLAGATFTDPQSRVSALTSEPRNIMAKGRPVADVLEEILSFLGLVMIPDLTEQEYAIQRANDYNKDWLTAERAKLIFEGGPVTRNDLILPKNIGLRVSSGPDPQIKLTSTAEYNAKGSGSLYLDAKHAGEVEDDELQNTSELNALRSDLISTHSQPSPELMVTLVGIHDLSADGFTDVEWRSTSEGAFTRGLVRKPKVKATRPEDGLFSYGSFYLPSIPESGGFLVKVFSDGGEAGSSTTTCSFTYHVENPVGGDLADGVSPQTPRIDNTIYTAATGYGWASYDEGELILLMCNETPYVESA